jgi:hypothetical protein
LNACVCLCLGWRGCRVIPSSHASSDDRNLCAAPVLQKPQHFEQVLNARRAILVMTAVLLLSLTVISGLARNRSLDSIDAFVASIRDPARFKAQFVSACTPQPPTPDPTLDSRNRGSRVPGIGFVEKSPEEMMCFCTTPGRTAACTAALCDVAYVDCASLRKSQCMCDYSWYETQCSICQVTVPEFFQLSPCFFFTCLDCGGLFACLRCSTTPTKRAS